ncbi:MAG TPA: hypothetical protein VNA25_09495 [Phycisphaerae bacterium]|nr:hypothetical protein [Phycisphaerae bacterium]
MTGNTADKLIGLLRIHCDLPCGLDLTENQQQFFADAAAQLVKGGPDSFSEKQAGWIAAIHGRALKSLKQGGADTHGKPLPKNVGVAPVGVKTQQLQELVDQRSEEMRLADQARKDFDFLPYARVQKYLAEAKQQLQVDSPILAQKPGQVRRRALAIYARETS